MRAFDTVSISKLISKLSLCGFREKFFECLTDFFTDGKLYVKVNGEKYETILQTTRIAHGTSFGPLSFSIYVNDFPLCLKHFVCVSYLLMMQDCTMFIAYYNQLMTFKTTCMR